MQKVFSLKLDLKLIKLVKENTVLYDYNDPKYADFNVREVAWQKIGDELEKPAADCKVRWINIRDVHRRILVKTINGSIQPKHPYKYDKQMAFMRKYYKEVVTEPLIEDDSDNMTQNWNDVVLELDNHIDSNEDDYQPVIKKLKKSPKPKKKRNEYKHKEKENNSDADVQSSRFSFEESITNYASEVDSFLMNIGTKLKKMSPYELNLAKTKIFSIVQEHDMQQILERQGSDRLTVMSQPVYFQSWHVENDRL